MSESCTHNCETCGESCSERTASSIIAPMNEHSSIKKVIAVVSGKGGVGKSLVTAALSTVMRRRGNSVAVLDADITGPSMPRVFGLREKAVTGELGILPSMTESGIEVMSVNLLLDDESTPVVWRGPVIAGAVKQFWSDIVWGDVDYMFVDMPPGTGDVPLTVFQSLPLDGIIVVTSPQELVGVIVGKAVNMAEMMNIPVIGIVENMSYFECPDCGKIHKIFGESGVEATAEKFGIGNVARLPIDPRFASMCDTGRIEHFSGPWLDGMADAVAAL